MKLSTLLAAGAAAVALLSPIQVAWATPEALTDEEMADARGGVLVAGSLAFQFGAVVSTYEDGVLSLQTQVTWTPDGPLYQQLLGPGVTPVMDSNLSALAGLGDAFLTPGGAVVLHGLEGGDLVNLLLNTQSGHDFRQDTDITLVLPGFDQTQQQMNVDLASLRLAEDMASSALSALPN